MYLDTPLPADRSWHVSEQPAASLLQESTKAYTSISLLQ